jgi:hypothetical protein
MNHPYQATGSLYGVATFAILAGAFVALTGWLWGWTFPSEDRARTSVQLTVFLAAGWFAMKVGKQRDVTYLRAVGRAIKGMVMR